MRAVLFVFCPRGSCLPYPTFPVVRPFWSDRFPRFSGAASSGTTAALTATTRRPRRPAGRARRSGPRSSWSLSWGSSTWSRPFVPSPAQRGSPCTKSRLRWSLLARACAWRCCFAFATVRWVLCFDNGFDGNFQFNFDGSEISLWMRFRLPPPVGSPFPALPPAPFGPTMILVPRFVHRWCPRWRDGGNTATAGRGFRAWKSRPSRRNTIPGCWWPRTSKRRWPTQLNTSVRRYDRGFNIVFLFRGPEAYRCYHVRTRRNVYRTFSFRAKKKIDYYYEYYYYYYYCCVPLCVFIKCYLSNIIVII